MSLTVHSPVAGQVLPMHEVPDPVFSGAMVGPGVAVDPQPRSRGRAVAPVAGKLVKLHPHAYVIQAEGGLAVLVHLGIDTVQLAGEGFDLLTTEGASVTVAEPVVEWEPVAVAAGGRSPVCPVVALDGAASELTELRESGSVAAGDPLFIWAR